MAQPPIRNGVTGSACLEEFRSHFDAAAADSITELGLFYDRHRNYLRYEKLMDPGMVEYTDVEWSDVMSAFLARLAREFGLFQARDWAGRSELAWFRPGTQLEIEVLIQQVDDAEDTILTRDVPALSGSGAELGVLIMYPDNPLPAGANSLAQGTEIWRNRIETRLRMLGLTSGFLLLTIGTDAWELPAPWYGFSWNPAVQLLEPLESAR